ncbi:MAG: c-type cytochrome biogenesis protein CcsB [Acidobacteria bacterium]|nr:MAG: c-type cytochrome biogenesis protein CcsB [Acidobacteriota bacterium]
MAWTLQSTVALYALGLLQSLFGFYRKRQVFVNVALALVGLGFATHTAFLVELGLERRHFPITSLSESLCFLAWSITLTFIIAYFRYRINVLGAFVLPFVSSLMVFSQLLWEENQSIPPLLRSRWLYLHTTVAFLAYAAFFLTFVSGVLYLIQEKELKAKRFRFFYFRLPALEVCDELLRRSLFAGFTLMSLTIVTGALWAQQAWGRFWSWDPKETASLITWAIYLVLVNYRLSAGWRGRRAAYISIVGFISALFTFGATSWFKGLHTYL